jgi:trans-aconitate methyltransferase
MIRKNKVQTVFDAWSRDYHADGMEKSHWSSVEQAFSLIPENNGNYLEIGIGNGYGIQHMASHQFSGGHCYGLDISPGMVKITGQRLSHLSNVTLESGDFLTWQPPSEIRFSIVFSMEVFYYFPDIQKGIDRASALLEPGGALMVLVNYYQENPVSHSWPDELNTPMVLWNKDDYITGFKRAGFRDLKQEILISDPDTQSRGTLATWGILTDFPS